MVENELEKMLCVCVRLVIPIYSRVLEKSKFQGGVAPLETDTRDAGTRGDCPERIKRAPVAT